MIIKNEYGEILCVTNAPCEGRLSISIETKDFVLASMQIKVEDIEKLINHLQIVLDAELKTEKLVRELGLKNER